MNKKARLYANNIFYGATRVKDSQQKSNQKKILNKSAERRKKINILLEKSPEKNQKLKSGINKSKITKQEKNIYNSSRNEQTQKVKEYTNTIEAQEKKEENIKFPKTEKKYDFLNLKNNKDNKTDEKEDNKKNMSEFNENIKLPKNDLKNSKKKMNRSEINNNDSQNEDYSNEEENEKDNDLLYRMLYKTSKKKVNNYDQTEKVEKNKTNKEDEKILKNQGTSENKNIAKNDFGITMEQTDNLHYNNEDKKIYLNAYNNNNKIRKPSVKKPKSKNDYRDKKIERDNYSKNDNIYSSKLYEKRKVINTPNYNTERAIDFFIIDNDYDIKFLTKTKKKINRKINKFKEITIENYEPNMPLKKDKFTGFVFMRKSQGKKIYRLELPDDIDKINDIFKNEHIMIKNEIIQFIPLQKLILFNNQTLNEIKKSQNEKNLEKEIEKEKEIIKDKERQITLLKNKNEELNNTIKKQTKLITQNEKEMKNIKFAHDQMKDSLQNLEQENKSLKSQLQALKLRRKSIQMQMEEESNQTQSLQEVKERIQKYKNELRKASVVEEKENNKKTVLEMQNYNNNTFQDKIKIKNNRVSVHSIESKKKEEQEPPKKNDKEEEKTKNNDEENYVDDYNYDMYDEKDPKARKMKNAVARFRKKYKDIIIENKKNIKLKEEAENKVLENNEEEENNILLEKERKEREEREKKEREEKEEKERKEKEKKEREERERKERERKEKERKEREERERKERERKEKEKKEKEEKERKEREEKERKEKEEKEKEKKINTFVGGQSKGFQNNFAKMLADKMKFNPMGAGLRKTSGGIDHSSKPPLIIEKKVDVVNLIEGQPFKRKTKKKPTRKMFVD